jgi:hypothetical protein
MLVDYLLIVWLEEVTGIDRAVSVDIAVLKMLEVLKLHPPGAIARLEHGCVPFLSEVRGIFVCFLDGLLNLKYASAANIVHHERTHVGII